jgi:L-threonylcarbamoyladenylate synthase
MFAAKGRPADHPVIVHLADASQMDHWADHVPEQARLLAAKFWPGPMTLILHRRSRVNTLVTGGLETVGLRVPRHPIAQSLLHEFGGGIAAPSANRFGRVSPTLAAHVVDELSGRIGFILDGGPCEVGLESTIIDPTGWQPIILRPGAITAEQIAIVTGQPVGFGGARSCRVPGNLNSHYAPRARVELVPQAECLTRALELKQQGERVALLERQPPVESSGIIFLPLPEDYSELARTLYARLRQADALGCSVIVTSVPESQGLGAAVADRLRKAAGPRDQLAS